MVSIPRATGAGFALGLVWGATARVWMRLISTDPEFSWTGTGMILGSTAVCGAALGFLYGARRAGRSRWWRLLGLCWLFVFAGPGIVFLPAYLLGGLLRLRQIWWKVIGAASVASGVLLLWILNQQEPVAVNPVTMYGGFLLLSLALAVGAAELYLPRPARQRQPAEALVS